MQSSIAKLKGLSSFLHEHVRGQNHALPKVCSVLGRGELNLSPPNTPKGSLLFLGPTGVGKTETIQSFTHYLFGAGKLFRFDMSEFQDSSAIKLLIGDETGREGRFGNILKNHSHGTLLFDEIEKAHPKIFDLFLQILDPGRITVGEGKTYSLSNFYITFTSNIGGEELMHLNHLRFASIERIVLDALYDTFRPEFIGRIQEKIVYKKLDYQSQREIALIALDQELSRLAKQGYKLSAPPEVLEFLIRKGMDRTLGARPMRGTVQKFVEDAIVFAHNSDSFPSGILRVDPTKQLLVISG